MNWSALLLTLGLVACSPQTTPQPDAGRDQPLFQFGLLADVQYADKNTVGRRAYRDVLPLLEECAADLAEQDLAFVVQLGDIIDGRGNAADSAVDLETALAPLEGMGHQLMHVIGNHCLEVPRAQLQKRLGLDRGWYSLVRNGWRFIVLDSMAMSIHGNDPQAAREWLKAHPLKEHPQASDWNGAFGDKQLHWLRVELNAAEQQQQRVVIFSHHPIHEQASSPAHLAWDYADALEVISASPSVLAFFSGHDHGGGYTIYVDVHHWTLPAMLEARAPSNAYAVVEVWPQRLVVRGEGEVRTRELAR